MTPIDKRRALNDPDTFYVGCSTPPNRVEQPSFAPNPPQLPASTSRLNFPSSASYLIAAPRVGHHNHPSGVDRIEAEGEVGRKGGGGGRKRTRTTRQTTRHVFPRSFPRAGNGERIRCCEGGLFISTCLPYLGLRYMQMQKQHRKKNKKG